MFLKKIGKNLFKNIDFLQQLFDPFPNLDAQFLETALHYTLQDFDKKKLRQKYFNRQ